MGFSLLKGEQTSACGGLLSWRSPPSPWRGLPVPKTPARPESADFRSEGMTETFTATDILSHIGNTPLVKLRRMGSQCPGVEILAKAEGFNPGGSVKDRPALNMVLEGERTGRLAPGKTLLDAT